MESATHRPIAEAFRARLNAATQMHVRNFIYSSFLRLFYSDFYNTFNYRCQFAPMVGAVRFELTTSCTRNKRATRLRYAPTQSANLPAILPKCNVELRISKTSCPRTIPTANSIGMSVAGTQLRSLRISGLESRRLALAFALSIAAHLLVWGGYELGKELNLWHLPTWLHIAKKKPMQPPL